MLLQEPVRIEALYPAAFRLQASTDVVNLAGDGMSWASQPLTHVAIDFSLQTDEAANNSGDSWWALQV